MSHYLTLLKQFIEIVFGLCGLQPQHGRDILAATWAILLEKSHNTCHFIVGYRRFIVGVVLVIVGLLDFSRCLNQHIPILEFMFLAQQKVAKEFLQKAVIIVDVQFHILVVGAHQGIAKVP